MKYILTTVFLLVAVGAYQSAMAAGSYSLKASASPYNATTINHPVAVNITVASSGLTDNGVYVTNIALTATSTSNPTQARLPMAFSQWNKFNTSVTIGMGSNINTNIGAGPLVFFSPSTGITGSGSGSYSIGGVVTLSDGSTTAITVSAAIKINPVPLPAYQRQ